MRDPISASAFQTHITKFIQPRMLEDQLDLVRIAIDVQMAGPPDAGVSMYRLYDGTSNALVAMGIDGFQVSELGTARTLELLMAPIFAARSRLSPF